MKGPRRDIVVLNAAAAIVVAGLADDFAQAFRWPKLQLTQGKALQCLEKLVEVSNRPNLRIEMRLMLDN